MEYQKCVKIPKKPFELPYATIHPHVPVTHCLEKPPYNDDHKAACPEIEMGYPTEKKVVKPEHFRPTPNPIYQANATLPLITPLAVTQSGNTILVTASIPAEAIITLPNEALEIKRISKKLKITQCRFFNAIPAPIPGGVADTPKLFLGGFVRKDIQYVKVNDRTATTVEGELKDFVVEVPVSGVVNLGTGLVIPELLLGEDSEFEYARRRRLGEGFPEKERLLSGDFTENNLVSTSLLNRLPVCELVYSQIMEMDDQLDRHHLWGAPFEEGTFRTLQEKMVIVVQIAITFPVIGG